VKNLLENAQQNGNLIKGSKDGITLAAELVNIFVKGKLEHLTSIDKCKRNTTYLTTLRQYHSKI